MLVYDRENRRGFVAAGFAPALYTGLANTVRTGLTDRPLFAGSSDLRRIEQRSCVPS